MPKGNGWIKLHRKILATELTSSQFKFFVGAILLAKSPKSQDSGIVDLSVRQLANELRMSRSEICRREKELEAKEMITLLKKGFLINNYHYYQVGKTVPPTGQSVPPMGQSVPPVGQSVPPHIAKSEHKNNKNSKNNKKGTANKRSVNNGVSRVKHIASDENALRGVEIE